MSLFSALKTVDFFRAEIVKKDNGYKPIRRESTVDLDDLVNHPEEDLSTFQSQYADKLLWGVPLENDVKTGRSGHYSTMVAAGRFVARYALDPAFRDAFSQNPSAFAIANSHSRVKPKDLFIFTEAADKKLYPLEGNKDKLEDGHLIAQQINPTAETTELVHPADFFNLLRILEETDTGFARRFVGRILVTAGYEEDDDFRKLEDECVIAGRDEKGKTHGRRLIDSINLAVLIAEQKIREQGTHISREQLMDIAARSFTSDLAISHFDPELISPSKYETELRKYENDLPKLEPDPEITGRHPEGGRTRRPLAEVA